MTTQPTKTRKKPGGAPRKKAGTEKPKLKAPSRAAKPRKKTKRKVAAPKAAEPAGLFASELTHAAEPVASPVRFTPRRRTQLEWHWIGAVAVGVIGIAVGLWSANTPLTPPAPAHLSRPVAQAPAQAPVAPAAQAAPPVAAAPAGQSEYNLASDFEKATKLPIGERIAHWTYQLRTSAAVRKQVAEKYTDTSYVEIVAALSRCRSEPEFRKALESLKAPETRATYFHENTEALATLAGIETQRPTRVPASDGAKSFIPISEIDQVIPKIQTGTIVKFLRDDAEVIHQGFLVRVGPTVWLRHTTPAGNVSQLPLADYLKKQAEDSASGIPASALSFSQLKDS